jgi:capsular polysaccharide biosynthesis protein
MFAEPSARVHHHAGHDHICRLLSSQATRAYLHAEADVERALSAAGFKVVKREMTATSFYFSRLLEAVRS